MRVISQDGKSDVPYERYSITVIKDDYCDIYHVTCDYSEKSLRKLAAYSTEAKAIKATEMLRKVYENNVFYHCTVGSKRFEEVQCILSEEQFRKATTEYFQFPQDDEIEV